MDRNELLTILTAFYKARLQNDSDAVTPFFADDGYFELVGSDIGVPAAKARGAALAPLVAQLVDTWEWKKQEFRVVIVEGQEASLTYELTVRHTPTGEEVKTTLNDVITMNGDKIKSFYEFADTALIAVLSKSLVRSEDAPQA
jgi:ketosteroid isomerase-like protein